MKKAIGITLACLFAALTTVWAVPQPPKVEKRLYPVVQDGRWGYIDQSGAIAIAPQFDKADTFSEGLAPVKLGKWIGYIDESGKIVINPQFEDGWAFENGLAPVRVQGKLGYINRAGEFVWKPSH